MALPHFPGLAPAKPILVFQCWLSWEEVAIYMRASDDAQSLAINQHVCSSSKHVQMALHGGKVLDREKYWGGGVGICCTGEKPEREH